jgi:hypothetical protein
MKTEEKKIIKTEKIKLKEKYLQLFSALQHKRSILDERIMKSMGKKIGFRTSDEKVYKLISAFTETKIDDILTSINHKNKKDIEGITKKYLEAKGDSKMPTKKLQNLHKNLMYKRVLTLKDLMNELRERREFVTKTVILPKSFLINEEEKVLEEISEEEEKEEKTEEHFEKEDKNNEEEFIQVEKLEKQNV